MRSIWAFISGLIFGLGLIVSGMVNPQKVIGFLDIFGEWDPSLALVMSGAIGIGIVAFNYVDKRVTTLLGDDLQLPTNKTVDKKLVLGSLIFGVGWGHCWVLPRSGIGFPGYGLHRCVSIRSLHDCRHAYLSDDSKRSSMNFSVDRGSGNPC